MTTTTRTKRPVPVATGDCYEAALHYMMDHRDELHLRLVHAEVSGQGKLEGMTLGHAWVEDGGWVIDMSNGRNIRMPKWRYYQIGKIHEHNNIHRYSYQEMAETCLEKGHYGPWVDSLLNLAL